MASLSRRILVPLALNELDEATLRYAGMIGRLVNPEQVYFLHVSERRDVPDELCRQTPGLCETSEDSAERRMGGELAAYFACPPGAQVRLEVLEGAPLVPVLDAIRRHDIDLAIMGRKPEQEWAGTLSERVTRKSSCSVLVVPRGAPPTIRGILVPVDFSPHASQALDTAVQLARLAGIGAVTCVHVYTVPAGYHKSGKTYEQFAQIMQSHAEHAYQGFIAARDLHGVAVHPRFVLDDHPAVAIKRSLDIERSDLLVLGSRGRTDSAAMLLGSVTERCLRTAHVPVLAVKHKGENMGFLEAVLSL